LAMPKSILRSIVKPIRCDGLFYSNDSSFVRSSKCLASEAARCFLLTTRSQRSRAGGQQGGPQFGERSGRPDKRATFSKRKITIKEKNNTGRIYGNSNFNI
jgi:hypothetical protein